MDLTSLPKVSATYYSKLCFRAVQANLLLSLWLLVLDSVPCGSYHSDECHDDYWKTNSFFEAHSYIFHVVAKYRAI